MATQDTDQGAHFSATGLNDGPGKRFCKTVSLALTGKIEQLFGILAGFICECHSDDFQIVSTAENPLKTG